MTPLTESDHKKLNHVDLNYDVENKQAYAVRSKYKWVQEVEIRVHGALSDLHADDAHFHIDYKAAFMAPKSVQNAQISKKPIYKDIAFNTIIDLMEADKNHIWSSVELYKLYTERN